MDSTGSGKEQEKKRLEEVIKNLEEIRNKLEKINQLKNNLNRVYAMQKEIESDGWSRVCQKYHPDMNIDDPAAFEVFELYRFVYSLMNKKML